MFSNFTSADVTKWLENMEALLIQAQGYLMDSITTPDQHTQAEQRQMQDANQKFKLAKIAAARAGYLPGGEPDGRSQAELHQEMVELLEQLMTTIMLVSETAQVRRVAMVGSRSDGK